MMTCIPLGNLPTVGEVIKYKSSLYPLSKMEFSLVLGALSIRLSLNQHRFHLYFHVLSFLELLNFPVCFLKSSTMPESNGSSTAAVNGSTYG
jgi:hypothetical protein